jgi:hypothetical protein
VPTAMQLITAVQGSLDKKRRKKVLSFLHYFGLISQRWPLFLRREKSGKRYESPAFLHAEIR